MWMYPHKNWKKQKQNNIRYRNQVIDERIEDKKKTGKFFWPPNSLKYITLTQCHSKKHIFNFFPQKIFYQFGRTNEIFDFLFEKTARSMVKTQNKNSLVFYPWQVQKWMIFYILHIFEQKFAQFLTLSSKKSEKRFFFLF